MPRCFRNANAAGQVGQWRVRASWLASALRRSICHPFAAHLRAAFASGTTTLQALPSPPVGPLAAHLFQGSHALSGVNLRGGIQIVVSSGGQGRGTPLVPQFACITIRI